MDPENLNDAIFEALGNRSFSNVLSLPGIVKIHVGPSMHPLIVAMMYIEPPFTHYINITPSAPVQETSVSLLREFASVASPNSSVRFEPLLSGLGDKKLSRLALMESGDLVAFNRYFIAVFDTEFECWRLYAVSSNHRLGLYYRVGGPKIFIRFQVADGGLRALGVAFNIPQLFNFSSFFNGIPHYLICIAVIDPEKDRPPDDYIEYLLIGRDTGQFVAKTPKMTYVFNFRTTCYEAIEGGGGRLFFPNRWNKMKQLM